MRNFILNATKICSFFNITLPNQGFSFTKKKYKNELKKKAQRKYEKRLSNLR